MGDLIDRVYDAVTEGAVIVGTALGVDMSDVELPKRQPVPDGPAFRVEEVIDAATGKVGYVVTDGCGRSCDAPTKKDADATLDALEAQGAKVQRS